MEFEYHKGDGGSVDTLSRFEFLEMIVRIVVVKYPDLSPGQAVTKLYKDCIVPGINDRALLDNDFFRYTCLYTEAVGNVLAERESRLKKVG